MLNENPAGLDNRFETIKNSVPLYLPVAQPINKITTDALAALVAFFEQSAHTYAQQACDQLIYPSTVITSDILQALNL